MARGFIVKRCPAHGSRSKKVCSCKGVPYSVVCTVGGKKRWENVGLNRHVAERKLAAIQAELTLGTFREPKPILFSEFAQKWLEIYAKPKVKPSTWETYRILIAHRFNPAFGKLLLTKITTEMIEEFFASMIHQKRKLAPKTILNSQILLKTMFKYAKRWGYLKQDSAEQVARIRVEPKEMDFLTPEEIGLLLKHSDGIYRTLFLTAILTGMRRGELLALQWGDIDWNQSRIYVKRSLYWRARKDTGPGEPCWTFVTPKSRYSKRAVVLSPKLKEALELHRLTCPVSQYDLVFSTRNGNPLDPENVIHHQFQPALIRSGLRHIRFHDLRHTFATLLIHQGENVKFIQSQLGHASATTTLDRYGHLMPNTQQEAGEKLDRLVFGGISATALLPKGAQEGQNGSKEQQDKTSLTHSSNKG